jgi:hypothetical protein
MHSFIMLEMVGVLNTAGQIALIVCMHLHFRSIRFPSAGQYAVPPPSPSPRPQPDTSRHH